MEIPYKVRHSRSLTPCPNGVTYQNIVCLMPYDDKWMSDQGIRKKKGLVHVGSGICEMCVYCDTKINLGMKRIVECSHPGNKES